MNDGIYRAIGRLEGKVDAMAAQLEEARTDVAKLVARDNRQRGAAAMVGACVSFVVSGLIAWVTK
jgi:cobalamin biosynthesis protein CobD/CbiB